MSTRGADAAWDSVVAELARRRREWDLLHLHSVAGRDAIQSALERHLGRRSARGDHRSSLHGRAAACRRIRWRAPARVSGITLASHSWSHRNMARLADSELRDELVRPLTWLRERFEGVIPWLAYPDGLASPQAARIAEEVGCAAACGVRGGRSAVPPGERFSVPRLNIPAGLSPSCFALRTAGLFAA